MPSPNVIQLRALLLEKFPGLRMGAGEQGARIPAWETGLPRIDEPLGGLPKGALSEVVAPEKSCGSSTLMHALIERAARENQIVALIDGADSFDITALGEEALSRLLWVRCRSASEAMKSADIILRDNNISLVLLDLASASAAELRKIPATTWHRFQRLVEEKTTVCVVLTPPLMAGAARVRFALRSRFSLAALETGAEALLRELKVEIAEAEQFYEAKRSA